MQPKTIAEQLFFTTVRIDTITANGAQGSGTGFFFSHKVGENNFPFVGDRPVKPLWRMVGPVSYAADAA